MMRLICSLLLAALVSPALAQDRSNYQLLWKIKGENTEPSYLFGTAHIKHPKAFDFSDSVLYAFDKSEVLALEISFDDYLKNLRLNSSESRKNFLKEELTEAQYDQLKDLIQKEADVDLDNLKSTSPLIIRRLLAERFNRKEKYENELTLDTYLFDVAKKQGKEVIGLEGIDAGIRASAGFKNTLEKEIFLKELLQTDSTEEASAMDAMQSSWFEELVEVYYQGDINQMYDTYASTAEKFGDPYKMVERNEIMARGIDSLVQHESAFVAVGAAHLGGEDGLIELLRARGYEVKPVNASFTGLAKDYKKQFEDSPGYVLEKLAEGYRVKLPGKPVESAIANTNLHMYTFQDMAKQEVVMVLSVESPDYLADEKIVFEMVARNMVERMQAELLENEHFVHEGTPAYKIEAQGPQANMLMYLFKRDTRIYMFGKTKPEGSFSKSETKDFLGNIELFDFTAKAVSWEKLENETHSFSIQMPAKYNFAEKDLLMEDGETYAKMLSYSAVDSRNKGSYVLNVFQYPTGYYVDNDSAIVVIYKVTVQQNYNAEMVDSGLIALGPYHAYQSIYRGKTREFSILNRIIVRGNKIFNLIISADSLDDQELRVANSLEFTPLHIDQSLSTFYAADSSYSVALPEDRSEFEESGTYAGELDKIETMSSSDESFDFLVHLHQYTYSPFAYYPTLDSLIESHLLVDTVNLTVLSDTFYNHQNGLRAYERVFEDKRVSYLTREKVLVNGKMVYQMQALIPLELSPEVADPLFQSLRVYKQDTLSLLTRRTERLLSELSSEDSATYTYARNQLRSYKFDTTELPLIYAALQSPMPLDTSTNWYGKAKPRLIGKFAKLQDEKTLNFLRNYFDTTSNKDIREKIIEVLADMEDSAAESLHLALFPQVDFKMYRLQYFYDTITRLYNNQDLLISLLDNPYLSEPVLSMYEYYLEDDTTHLADSLKPHFSKFEQIYATALDTMDLDSLDYRNGNYLNSLLSIFTELGGSEEMAPHTRKLLEVDYYYTKVAAIIELLGMDEKLKKSLFKEMFSDKEQGYQLLYQLNKQGHQEILKAHLDQKEVAEIFVRSELYYEDYNPEEVKLIDVAETDLNGGVARVYIYYYTTEYDDGPQLAFTAAQPASKEARYKEDYTSIWFGKYEKDDFERQREEIIAEVKSFLEEE